MIPLSTIVSYAKKELGIIFTNEAHPDIVRYMNSAGRFIYNYRDWQMFRKEYTVVYTTPGSEVTIPFNTKTFYVLGEDGQTPDDSILINNEEWFLGHEGACVSGDKFKARGAGTYRIFYTPGFTALDGTETYVDLPENFEEAFQTLTVYFGKKDIQDYDTANALMATAKAILDPITERATNIQPRKKKTAGGRHNIF